MSVKTYFLAYMRTDYGELEFCGQSVPKKVFISLNSTEEESARDEALKIWNNILGEAKKFWEKKVKAKNLIEKKNEGLKKKLPVKHVYGLHEWKPCNPELVCRAPLIV